MSMELGVRLRPRPPTNFRFNHYKPGLNLVLRRDLLLGRQGITWFELVYSSLIYERMCGR